MIANRDESGVFVAPYRSLFAKTTIFKGGIPATPVCKGIAAGGCIGASEVENFRSAGMVFPTVSSTVPFTHV